ncbi:hypothetical protein Tco_1412521 [Tanacetum coccineum]
MNPFSQCINLEHLAVVAMSVGSSIPIVHDWDQEPVLGVLRNPILIDLDGFNDVAFCPFHRILKKYISFGGSRLYLMMGDH